jgi:hypothetical protein
VVGRSDRPLAPIGWAWSTWGRAISSITANEMTINNFQFENDLRFISSRLCARDMTRSDNFIGAQSIKQRALLTVSPIMALCQPG